MPRLPYLPSRPAWLSYLNSRALSTHSQPPLLKILFLGSDHFSIGSLRAVFEATGLWESINVVTVGSKEVGRGKGKKLMRPPLCDWAEENGLSLEQLPASGIKSWQPPAPFHTPHPTHHLLTSSFGLLLPPPLLNLFPHPSQRLNVHPSLLPSYRGAAPIQHAIRDGRAETGVSVQSLEGRIDAGEVWGRREGVTIGKKERYEELLPRLATIGGDLLLQMLREIQAGTTTSTPQKDLPYPPSRAPKITKDTAKLDFGKMGVEEICALDRAIGSHYPLWTEYNSTPIQLFSLHAHPSPQSLPHAPPGTFLFARDHLLIHTRGGVLSVGEVKAAGGRRVGARDWVNGLRGVDGRAFGSTGEGGQGGTE